MLKINSKKTKIKIFQKRPEENPLTSTSTIVRVSGEFDLTEFELAGFYCNICCQCLGLRVHNGRGVDCGNGIVLFL